MANHKPIISLKRCPHHMPSGWNPPVPAYSADLHADTQITVLYLGVQRPTDAALRAVNAMFAKTDTVSLEFAEFTDRAGDVNRAYIAYFQGADAFSDWCGASNFDAFLSDDKHLNASYGLWTEIYAFQRGQFETLFSTPDSLEGGGQLASKTVGPIREHSYWGGTEDRIPNFKPGNFDARLAKMPAPKVAKTRGRRIKVQAPDNFCLIRSGQDLRAMKALERDEYDAEIEPALREGLAYLADNAASGCFESRYMQHCSQNGVLIEKTFGMQLFLSIKHLLDWAKSHPTHLKIFKNFQTMALGMQGQIDLRLWHEIAVIAGKDIRAEYINCNAMTGLLPFTHVLSHHQSTDNSLQAQETR